MNKISWNHWKTCQTLSYFCKIVTKFYHNLTWINSGQTTLDWRKRDFIRMYWDKLQFGKLGVRKFHTRELMKIWKVKFWVRKWVLYDVHDVLNYSLANLKPKTSKFVALESLHHKLCKNILFEPNRSQGGREPSSHKKTKEKILWNPQKSAQNQLEQVQKVVTKFQAHLHHALGVSGHMVSLVVLKIL